MRIIVVLVACLLLAGCGGEQESASFTPAEQEIMTFIAGHVQQMEGLVTGLSDVLSSGSSDVGIMESMDPIVTDYAALVDAYHATNGGENAGGRVARLEALWVECSDNVQTVGQAILMCYTDPENVDVAEAAEALVLAEQGVEDIRAELEALTGQTY